MNHSRFLVWLAACVLCTAVFGQPGTACTDPCLKAAISALYIRSPFLSPFRIDIAVEDAVATLEGTVSDAGERALAGEIASGIDGITAVINRIRVDPSQPARDRAQAPVDCLTSAAALVDRVTTQLYWHRATHGMRPEVSARDGTIILQGAAANPQQAELARLIALNTCGVQRVESRITIR
jgi:osmotically-inducible protein OsmY